MWTDFQNSFHQLIRTNILYVYTAKISTSPAIMLLHYLVEVENPKKCYYLTASSTNFSHVPEDTLRT